MQTQEYKTLLRLALPIVVGQLGMTLQAVVDTIMLGHYSTEALAAVGLVGNLSTLAAVVVMGFAAGVVPLAGASYGRGDRMRSATILKNALLVITLFALVAMAVLYLLFRRLDLLGQPRELWGLMQTYLFWTLPSMLAVAWGSTFKSFFDSMNATRVAMWAILVGNAWNVAWNYALIFGHWGMPEMGVKGAAIATTTSRFLILLIYYAALGRTRPLLARVPLSYKMGLRVTAIGAAIATQSGLEVGSFSICAVFVGWMGSDYLAAQQVIHATATTIWIIYFSIASATAVRVSNHMGRHDMARVRYTSRCGLRLIIAMAAVLSVFFLLTHLAIFHLFTTDARLIAILTTIVPAVVLYQFGDATQTHYVNVLRGMGCVKYLVLDAAIAYALITLPLAYTLGIALDMKVGGIWMAYPVGLTAAAALYIRRYRRYGGQPSKAEPQQL